MQYIPNLDHINHNDLTLKMFIFMDKYPGMLCICHCLIPEDAMWSFQGILTGLTDHSHTGGSDGYLNIVMKGIVTGQTDHSHTVDSDGSD